MNFDNASIDHLTSLVTAISGVLTLAIVLVHAIVSALGRKEIINQTADLKGVVLDTKATVVEGTAKVTGSPIDALNAEIARATSDAHAEESVEKAVKPQGE